MKILMVNKFLYPNGGSETYMFGLGQQLEKMGHEVQYFGMEHEGRCVGNRVGAYTSSMDFHGGSRLAKLIYPLKTIYSSEARQKLRLVLDDFRPDVIHLNNFNYQLTPSVLLEADKWRRESGQPCRILYTAHDHLPGSSVLSGDRRTPVRRVSGWTLCKLHQASVHSRLSGAFYHRMCRSDVLEVEKSLP